MVRFIIYEDIIKIISGESDNVKCPNCKKTINLKLKFCPYCGKMISKRKFKGKNERISTRPKIKPIQENKIKQEQKKKEQERKKQEQKKKEQERKKQEQKKKEQEKIKNNDFNFNIYHAELSDVYFIYDYIKSEIRKDYKKNNVHLTSEMKDCLKIDQKLIKYKYEDSHVNFFTKELLKAIKIIFDIYFAGKEGVALVAVPPSEKNKDPQTKKSIELIEEWCKEGKNEIDFKIYNKSAFLKRTKDVESSKSGDRSIEKHENSIECDEEDILPSNIGVIILDDITTSGKTMYVCKNKLIENGLNDGDVIPLAIARTVRPHTEIYTSMDGALIIYDEDVEVLK